MNKPLVSVIIPVYNMEDYLEETVQSVLKSTYSSIEVVLVDDGSKDRSALVGKRLADENENIRFYTQPNKGVASARNHAISLSEGKYILPVDADDLISSDFIAQAVDVLESQGNVMVVSVKGEFIGARTGEWKLPAFSLHLLARKNMIPASAVFRKSDWARVGGYCENIIAREDWEFWIALLKQGGQVVCLPETGLYYRIRPNSKRVSDRTLKKKVIDVLNRRHPEFFLQYLNGPLRYQRSYSRLINFFSNLMNAKKVVVHSDYKRLEPFLYNLPDTFSGNGIHLYKGRNELKVFEIDGVEYVVKSYQIPNFINRIIYGTFRESKAGRAYWYALKFLEAGIGTPMPVGYINIQKCFLFSESYFVCQKSVNEYQYNDLLKKEFENKTEILQAIALMTARMHDCGFLHKDYSGGNILFRETVDGVSVEIIDLNRMQFGSVSLQAGCKNFERLPGDKSMFVIIGREYAKARHLDEVLCINAITSACSVKD